MERGGGWGSSDLVDFCNRFDLTNQRAGCTNGPSEPIVRVLEPEGQTALDATREHYRAA